MDKRFASCICSVIQSRQAALGCLAPGLITESPELRNYCRLTGEGSIGDLIRRVRLSIVRTQCFRLLRVLARQAFPPRGHRRRWLKYPSINGAELDVFLRLSLGTPERHVRPAHYTIPRKFQSVSAVTKLLLPGPRLLVSVLSSMPI